MKAGKQSGNAVLRTLANKNALNFATKRILKDLAEIENNTVPTVGVTARPIEKDLFTWCANIKGPEGTPYEGGVFHLVINIPESYPHNPPSITLKTCIPHPNVFGTSLCLDMLQPSEPGKSGGWTSAYTILSILIQLQSFLFEKTYDDDQAKENKIKKAVAEANQYKCCVKSCKHGGKLACYPPFNVKDAELDAFTICETEKQLFEKELVCYHTKLTHVDTCLGIGLSLTRVPRTGAIRQASPILDYVSIKAYIKEGVRNSVDNELFTNWLPLYFGQQPERALHLGRKAMSMIYTSNTKRFKESMVIDAFPKMLLTLSFQMMDEKRHPSVRIIRLFTQIHCFFLLFLQTYPDQQAEIERIFNDFLTNEKSRHKDVTANLGIILIYSLVCEKSKQKDMIKIYFEEQLDRQVFWMMKAIPELKEASNDADVHDKRAQLTFKQESTSYQILCFFIMMNKYLNREKDNNQANLKTFEQCYGKFSNSVETAIQKECFGLLSIDNYNKFFDYIGLPRQSNEEINNRLRQAIQNSSDKKYHGTDDEMHTLPSTDEQMQELLKDVPTLEGFINREKKTFNDGLTEEKWKQATIQRWSWIKEYWERNHNITPNQLLEQSKKIMLQGVQKPEDRLITLRDGYLKNNLNTYFSEDNIIQTLEKNLTWQNLFIRLDIEYHLQYMDQNPDFKLFYDKLQASANHINSLIVPISVVKQLKSGYHYITSLLSHLTQLKNIDFVGPAYSTNNMLPFKAIKCINKGFHNFSKAGGSLNRLCYHNFSSSNGNSNEIADALYSPILKMPELVSMNILQSNLLQYQGGKYIGNLVTQSKTLQELNLSQSNLNEAMSKLLADGIMRAKQLRSIDLSKNYSMSHTGLSSILYNLAFSPKLQVLNLGYCSVSVYPQVVESLHKLLRISGSLEILLMNQCGNINTNLSKDFFASLGEIRTLKLIDMSFSGNLNLSAFQNLGKAIAFNAKNNGSLEYIGLENCVPNSNSLSQMYANMNISKVDWENWYGDVNKVAKMSGDDYEKTFYNNLKGLNVGRLALNTSFNLANFKKQFKPEDPAFMKLLAQSPQLENVQFKQVSFNKLDADFLSLALDPTRPNFASKIKILNLSKNQLLKEGAKALSNLFTINNIIEVLDISNNKIGVSGAQSLAEALTKNSSLKYLNLFANKIDVDGARAFQKCLASNKSLEWIDFGHNRLRDEGILALAKGISSNPDNQLKCLGFRFNFIHEDAIIEFLKKINKDGKSKLQDLFIKNNAILEYGLYQLKKVYDDMKIQVHIDLLEKLLYTEVSRLDRSIWIYPTVGTQQDIKKLFEVDQKCGVVVDIRTRKGPKWPNRRNENQFYLVEFAHPTSVTRALHVASRKKASLHGTAFKIFKAGSSTYYYNKTKRSKAKSETNVLARGVRVRGGRARGRGRGTR